MKQIAIRIACFALGYLIGHLVGTQTLVLKLIER